MLSSYLAATQLIHNYSRSRDDEAAICVPGISLWIEECTQCGASSGPSETLGENHSSHFLVVSIPVPVSVPAFLCFPVAQ